MSDILKKLFQAANQQAQDAANPSLELQSLQALVQAAWETLSPQQKKALLQSATVEGLVEAGGRGALDVPSLLGTLSLESEQNASAGHAILVQVSPEFEPEDGDVFDAVVAALDFAEIPAVITTSSTLN